MSLMERMLVYFEIPIAAMQSDSARRWSPSECLIGMQHDRRPTTDGAACLVRVCIEAYEDDRLSWNPFYLAEIVRCLVRNFSSSGSDRGRAGQDTKIPSAICCLRPLGRIDDGDESSIRLSLFSSVLSTPQFLPFSSTTQYISSQLHPRAETKIKITIFTAHCGDNNDPEQTTFFARPASTRVISFN